MAPDSTSASQRPARLRFGSGARATEALLVDDLERRLARITPAELERPVLLIVPSRSLRSHLLARIVARRGRAVAGLACTTLFGFARQLVDGHDGPPNLHDELARLLARRFAQEESSLRGPLAHLREGFRAVDGSVRDLLEAGLEPAHVEAFEEALADDGAAAGASRGEVERARALVRIAGRTAAALDELGLLATPGLLRRAAEIARQQVPESDEPGQGRLYVYGFSDAIGVATDLLVALLDRYRGTLYVDRPPDPVAPERPDAGNRFTRRFVERILDIARPEEAASAGEAPAPALFQAIGGEAEAREVAARIRGLLDDGAVPERIGIVARRLEPHRGALRIQLERLAVPFSAAGAPGPRGPAGRRVRALLDLLERGPAVAVERWLEARSAPFPRISNFDLHLALSTIGAGRLEEVSGRPYDLVARGASYPLPVRRGFSDDEEEVYAHRRVVPLSALKEAAAAAHRLCRLLEEWRHERRLAEHARRLRQLLTRELGWAPSDELSRSVSSILDGFIRGLPPELEVGFDEFVDAVRSPLDGLGLTPFGGAGGGVRLLDAIEARGLTFEHLFVIGLNRGVFPRVVNEDPLLPDSLRAVLSRHGFGVLQDLPQKLAGFDEERYLFSQLVSAADAVTLSWQDVDEDNHQLTASPLVERLRWSPERDRDDWRLPATARPLYSAASARRGEPGWRHRPAHEAAVLAGVFGDRQHFARVLAVAVAEAAADSGSRPPRGLHAVRLRILDEIDPRRGTPAGERTRSQLGPYFGFVGPIAPRGDPRLRDRLFVTTLEGLASCSWRAFLERLLRLQPIPDPLEALPAVEPLYIGSLVHRVLEKIVTGGDENPASLAEARAAARPVAWPAAADLEALLAREAAALVREEGFGFPGFARLLAEVVNPYLETARRLEWGESGVLETSGAELFAGVTIRDGAGETREISFKADRVDGGGTLSLTDYKTGRPLSDKKTPAARRKALLKEVSAGQRMQAVAYALAAGQPGDRGRYLFLKPDAEIPDDRRVAAVEADDAPMTEAFLHAARAALAAWDRGTFLPRLIEPRGDREFRFCASCRVAEACLRGDSGSRGRLRDWLDAQDPEEPRSRDERALLRVWKLRPEGAGDDWKGRRG